MLYLTTSNSYFLLLFLLTHILAVEVLDKRQDEVLYVALLYSFIMRRVHIFDNLCVLLLMVVIIIRLAANEELPSSYIEVFRVDLLL